MIKRILILCTLLLISAYLVLAVTAFNGKPDNRICKGMELVVKDSVNFGFVTPAEVKALLKSQEAVSGRETFEQHQCSQTGRNT